MVFDSGHGSDGGSMRERMLAGNLYLASDPELQAGLLRAARLVERFNRSPADDPQARSDILHQLLAYFGPGAEIRAPFYCDYGTQISFGARSFANFGLVALDVVEISIGEDVQIGPNVQLLTATHPVDPRLRRDKWEAGKPITIEDNVWLGGGVIVCPGVTIGANTVVGAGAVVTQSLPANVLATGNPARVVRPIA